MLARGRNNWYSPLNADPSGLANLGMYDILATTSSTSAPNGGTFPPYPTDTNYSDEVMAFTYIMDQFANAGLICDGCNVRDAYANTNFSVNSVNNNLTTMNDPCPTTPAGQTCAAGSSSAFSTVRSQLLLEFAYQGAIQNFEANLNNVWEVTGTTDAFSLISTSKTVEATLPTLPPASAPSLAGPIVNLLLGVAASLPTPLAPVFGVIDTAFNFGMGLTTDPNGNQVTSLAMPVADLAKTANTQFIDLGGTIGTQFDLICQNWAKFSTLGQTLVLEATQPGSVWYWNGDTTTSSVLGTISPSVEQAYYQNLMSAVYAIGRYLPQCINIIDPSVCNSQWGDTPIWMQPQTYWVYDPGGPFSPGQEPYAQPFNYPWYPSYTFPGDVNNPTEVPSNPAYTQAHATLLADFSWLGISLQSSPADSGRNGLYNPPAASVLAYLFTPPNANGTGD